MSAPVVAVGMRLTDREQFAGLPQGTVLLADDGERFILQGTSWWHAYPEGGGYQQGACYCHTDSLSFSMGFNAVERFGETSPPEPVYPADVSDCMDRVREAIDDCVEGNGYADARTAAYWRLGMDPMPVEGDTLRWGAALGLPHGSVVRSRYGAATVLWTVNKNTQVPTELVASTRRGSIPMNAGADVEVVLRAQWEPPVWEHANQFLHAVWALQNRWRPMFGWCPAVVEALQSAGLDDPGENAPPPEPVRVHGVLTVGYTVDGDMSEVEQVAFGVAPTGTVVAGEGFSWRIKHDGQWLAPDLRPDPGFYRYRNVTVTAMP